MNRPEPIELENNLGPDAVTGEINRVPWMAYDVDEMDLYIAEKDKEIAELKADYKEACGRLQTANLIKDEQLAATRHNKYKRCLAMARICEDEAEINHNSAYEASEYMPSKEDYFRRKAEHYERWRKRWLKLAEEPTWAKFLQLIHKEAK